ncbi:hypothetical protein PsorP6_007596 [Peronosclerospora sorghi]|uniref:Uncharacterized protein n=1 Tax=Peronosclerospora sorghi TaxID=230839 RepID=A0ACC0WB50_9STRA|nr:hypothetical protein PsorP6_007596 [Peronosclerospora sorghi]
MVTIDGREITVTEVLFSPNLDRRIFSIPKLTSRGLDVMFGHRSCDIMKNGKIEWEIWNARLGHTHLVNYRRLQLINPELPVVNKPTENLCGGCIRGKKTVSSFPQQTVAVKTDGVLQLVHMDMMGPMKTQSHGGAKYVLVIIDDLLSFCHGVFSRRW